MGLPHPQPLSHGFAQFDTGSSPAGRDADRAIDAVGVPCLKIQRFSAQNLHFAVLASEDAGSVVLYPYWGGAN